MGIYIQIGIYTQVYAHTLYIYAYQWYLQDGTGMRYSAMLWGCLFLGLVRRPKAKLSGLVLLLNFHVGRCLFFCFNRRSMSELFSLESGYFCNCSNQTLIQTSWFFKGIQLSNVTEIRSFLLVFLIWFCFSVVLNY